MKVAVTGGSGRAGRYIIPELLAHDHEVVNADLTPGEHGRARFMREDVHSARFMRADVTDFNDVMSALAGAEGIIHLAATPSPVRDPERRVFEVNMLSNWAVLEAAEILGIPKLVMASSINAVGASFSKRTVSPAYFPIDEEHPTRAEDAYSQSKWLGEQMADAFCRRREAQIASMRFHALWDEELLRAFKANPRNDVEGRAALAFWGWVDLRDAARACRLALERDWVGHEAFFINGSDTTLSTPTEEALAKVYPGVPLRRPLPGFTAAIDISKAERILGWKPEHSWRDE